MQQESTEQAPPGCPIELCSSGKSKPSARQNLWLAHLGCFLGCNPGCDLVAIHSTVVVSVAMLRFQLLQHQRAHGHA